MIFIMCGMILYHKITHKREQSNRFKYWFFNESEVLSDSDWNKLIITVYYISVRWYSKISIHLLYNPRYVTLFYNIERWRNDRFQFNGSNRATFPKKRMMILWFVRRNNIRSRGTEFHISPSTSQELTRTLHRGTWDLSAITRYRLWDG